MLIEFSWENLKEREHLENLVVNGKMMLNYHEEVR
jgi:hypothetical protein